jgi:hypothetical protein
MNDSKLNLPDVSRRGFVGAAITAGSLLAHSDDHHHHHGKKCHGHPHKKEVRDFFVNLSHETYSGRAYHLVVGKRRYCLRELHSGDSVLGKHQQRNKFLAQLPDSRITHVIENVELSTDAVHLTYLISDPNTTTGEWNMSAVYLLTPMVSQAYAYKRAREINGEGAPLPISAKRRKYGVAPAESLQDLMDEQTLLDTTDWASAMVNLHPEMVSADPDSAAHVQTNYIQREPATFQLSQVLEVAGPATPQADPSQPNNAGGWATLVPYTDDDGSPLINTKGNNVGLILYDAKWQPALSSQFVGSAMKPAIRKVKNDTTLGADVTNNDEVGDGCLWTRNDGSTSLRVNPQAGVTSSGSFYTLSNITPGFAGYSCTAAATIGGDNAQVTLTFKNWYVRYLGLYIQFLSGKNVVPVSSLPSGTLPDTSYVTANNEILIGSLTPEFTLYGIPILASANSLQFTFPSSVATTAKILASGLGTGTHTASDTELLGRIMTILFNLAIPAAMLVLTIGTEIDIFVKTLAFPFATLVAKEIATAVPEGNQSQIISVFWKSIVKGAATPILKQFVTGFLAFLASSEVVDGLEDAIPIAGEIIQAIGAIGTEAEIAETTIEAGSSPWTYEYDLTGTYNLSLAINKPTNDSGFPSAAASYTVTAIFDNGTPQVQTIAYSNPTNSPTLVVGFPGVPLGGNVTLSVGFYTVSNELVGHGTTGSISNVPSTSPTITITEVQLPITSATVYKHYEKTSLDSNGNHLWICTPVAPMGPANPVACDPHEGNICSYRDITFSPTLSDVGYAWQSYSNAQCSNAVAGQLDQMASIPNVNSGENAQAGYASLPHAMAGAGRLIFDPMGKAGNNYYLDTTNGINILRQVALGGSPVFPDPCGSNQAWGQFTLPPDDILLHPSGAIITVNSALSRMESLKLPAGSVPDAQAPFATLHGGLGTRPGLFSGPTVATITADGVVLIVESGNNRIHAVDAFGNPVRHFTNQAEPYFLPLTATGGNETQYLDIAAEFSGLIYLLSVSNSVYRLDIYAPDASGTTPLSTTQNLNAAKVTVDYWRNVYSLNYEVLTVDGAIPASRVTEPSISKWLPTTPPACDLRTPPSATLQNQSFASPGRVSRRSWMSASLSIGGRRSH